MLKLLQASRTLTVSNRRCYTSRDIDSLHGTIRRGKKMDNVQQQVIIYALMGVAGVVALNSAGKKTQKSSKTSAATDGVPTGKKSSKFTLRH